MILFLKNSLTSKLTPLKQLESAWDRPLEKIEHSNFSQDEPDKLTDSFEDESEPFVRLVGLVWCFGLSVVVQYQFKTAVHLVDSLSI